MKKKHIGPYLGLIAVITVIMFYLALVKDQILFFSYFNTFLGTVFWFVHILKKDYPMVPIALVAFLTKFFGDSLLLKVYLGVGGWLTDVLCVLLPILEFAFIPVFFVRRRQRKRAA